MNQDKEKKQLGIDSRVLLLLGVVVILLIAGAAYFLKENSQLNARGEPVPAIDTPAAQLLLSTYEAGAALKDYYLEYRELSDGVESRYQIGKNGTSSWVNLTSNFGNLEAFFGENESSDVVCLAYGGERRCAMAENNSDVKGVLSNIKKAIPDRALYLSQKDQMRFLITNKAITIEEVSSEKINGFEATKISYSLDYRQLTVKQLMEAGISPDSPEVTSVTNRKITYWIDGESKLVAKVVATYYLNGVAQRYEREYFVIKTEAAQLPPKPEGLISASSFAAYHQSSVKDFVSMQTCEIQKGYERDKCYVALGAERKKWEVCKKITNATIYEQCTLVVAQLTNNKVLCEKLDILKDDCYISVVKNTGEYELCKKLKNSSLVQVCINASIEGQKKVAAEAERLKRLMDQKNCAADSDCKVVGNARQYCVPKNDTRTFPVETGPILQCYANLSCICNSGFCGFNKTSAYYECVAKAEEGLIEEFLSQQVKDKANKTTNETGPEGAPAA